MKKFPLAAFMVLFLTACSDATTNRTSVSSDSVSSTNSTAGNSNKEVKEERNKQAALASVKGFSEGDVDVILKDWDPNVLDYGDGSMPPIKGVDSARTGLTMWLGGMRNFNVNNLIAIAEDDMVMVYGTWSGTWKSDIMGMKATGKSFKANDVDIFRFNDAGKIVEHRGVQSMNELARQLGMKLPAQ